MRIVKITYTDDMPKEQHDKLQQLFTWLFVKNTSLPTQLQAQLLYFITNEQRESNINENARVERNK
jgi:hypothetical protein